MIWIILAVLVLIVGLALIRVGEWKKHESIYWYNVDLKVLLNPQLDDHYRPILMWARGNRPTFFGCLRKWENPQIRQAKQIEAQSR